MSKEDINRLFGFNGISSSFSATILASYTFRIIGKNSRFDLDLIRTIRNGFAHSRTFLDFSVPEVVSVCMEFKIFEMPGSMTPGDIIFTDTNRPSAKQATFTGAKALFFNACRELSYRMSVKRNGPRPGDIAFPDDDPLP